MKEAVTVRRKARARYTSNKTTTVWEEYDTARKKVQEMVEKKKGIYIEKRTK